ncbi:hypothetical protein ACQJBY_043800 [Aegilops geniculata]
MCLASDYTLLKLFMKIHAPAKCRVRVGHAPVERPPCAGRISALEKTLRTYAEKKTETVVVPVTGINFDSLGEAYDYYNLYSWEVGFGIRYVKSRLNVERTKCMQEIVCGCVSDMSNSVQPLLNFSCLPSVKRYTKMMLYK